MEDYLKLSIAYDGSFVASNLIISVDGKKVNAGRKRFGGFEFTREGKALLDTLPKREPRVAPIVEAPRVEAPAPVVKKRAAPRRKKRVLRALESTHEDGNK